MSLLEKEHIAMTGRPQSSEAADYYFKYIDLVPGDDVLGFMEQQVEPFLKLASEISEEKSLHVYAPGKWSIRQLLGHVTDAERVFAFRALWFARGFEAALPSFDQEAANTYADANAISWAEHVEEFRRVRMATISLFKNMSADGWARSGTASNMQFSVRAVAFILAGHLTYHTAILTERYLLRGWPD